MTFEQQNNWIKTNLSTAKKSKLESLLSCYRKHNFHGIYGDEVNKGEDYSDYKEMIIILSAELQRRKG